MIRQFAFCAVLAAVPAAAQELVLPQTAQQLTERILPLESYDLPVEPFADGILPVRVFEGQVEKHTWKISAGAQTTLQVLRPLRAQLIENGYEIVLECEARTCGGFDFRFATEVIPGPDMYVAIRDYRFLSAIRGDEAISLLVSRNSPSAFVQAIHVFPASQSDVTQIETPEPSRETEVEVEPDTMLQRLQRDGHAVLENLEFAVGANALGNGPFASLRALAGIMRDQPDIRIVLVGHTDNVGSLNDNMALSMRRADAVKRRLVDQYGIEASRLDARGMGYLSPLTSNATSAGRESNRRVEAVLMQN